MCALSPLADVLAVRCVSAEETRLVRAKLLSAQYFDVVWQPHPSWLVATRALPLCTPDDDVVRRNGLVFVEGRDRVEQSAAKRQSRAERITEFSQDFRREPPQIADIPGDVTVLRFDASGTVTLARSCGGRVPLYVARSAGRTAIATRLKLLSDHVLPDAVLDPLASLQWMTTAVFPDCRSPLRDVIGLPRGTFAVIEDGKCTTPTSYWHPQRASSRRPSAYIVGEHQAELRTHLVQHLEREIDPDGRNLLSLSGGVDSSSLLALCHGVLRRSTSTWSLIPPPWGRTRDRDLHYINTIREHCGVTRSWEREYTVDTWNELIHQSPLGPAPSFPPTIQALETVRNEADTCVYVGGEFADEICGSRLTAPDWAEATSSLRLLATTGCWPKRWGGLRQWAQLRIAMHRKKAPAGEAAWTPSFLPPELQTEHQDWIDQADSRAYADDGINRHLYNEIRNRDFTAMNWEGTAYHGIRRCLPFCTREVFELALRTHPSERVGPGYKRLLRGALRDDVPHAHLMRPDKGTFQLSDEKLRADSSTLELERDDLWGTLHTIVDPGWRGNAPKSLPFLDYAFLLMLKRTTQYLTGQPNTAG